MLTDISNIDAAAVSVGSSDLSATKLLHVLWYSSGKQSLEKEARLFAHIAFDPLLLLVLLSHIATCTSKTDSLHGMTRNAPACNRTPRPCKELKHIQSTEAGIACAFYSSREA